jgi:hypothetical protein
MKVSFQFGTMEGRLDLAEFTAFVKVFCISDVMSYFIYSVGRWRGACRLCYSIFLK